VEDFFEEEVLLFDFFLLPDFFTDFFFADIILDFD
jgi:hypothetical protein